MQSYMTYPPEEEDFLSKPEPILGPHNSQEEQPFSKQPLNQIAVAYMVAGLSSRFGGKIKQFARIGPNNETLIEYSINQALKAGFNKIIFIVGEKTEIQFKEMFGFHYNEIPIEYAFQHHNKETRDRPWGTVDAVCTLKGMINHPVVICNGDDIYGEESFQTLFNHLNNSTNKTDNSSNTNNLFNPNNSSNTNNIFNPHNISNTNKQEATVGYKILDAIPDQGATHRGIFKTDNLDSTKITDLKETFNIEKSKLHLTDINPNDLVSMNIWALYPESIDKLNQQLQNFKQEHKDSRTAECLLPDEIGNLIRTNKLNMKLYKTNAKWFGVTNPEDEMKVREELRELN